MSKTNASPFDDIRNLIATMPSANEDGRMNMQAKLEDVSGGLKPLGQLDEIVSWLASWYEPSHIYLSHPLVALFVGTHSVMQYVSGEDPLTLAKKRLKLVADGQAGVRGIARSQGAAYKIYEMGIDEPARDMRTEPSLSVRECAQAIAFGMEVVSGDVDLIALGNAGVGTATAAAGIARGLYGGAAEYWAGGKGEAAQRRIIAVGEAAHFHKDILGDPLEVLRCFGGRDMAGMVGAILAARHQKIPVLLDGYAVCSAAAILHALDDSALDHCLAAHVTAEPAHGALLDRIGKTPLLNLGLGIGDGSGAAITIGVIKAASEGARTLFE